ncbi:MAG: DUF2953 domain-containing protein [Clostridiales bacterium]|nr:DUF2953 domain-containing protein [Clostridiales bacterium]
MTALLKVLKFIGSALLWVIAVVLIILLIVLFCPIYYDIKGEKYDKTVATAKIKLLLGILSVKVGFADGNVDLKIKIFGKELNLDKKGKKDKKDKKKKDKPKSEDKKKPKGKKVEAEKPELKKASEPKQAEKPKSALPERNTEPKISVKIDDWENTDNTEVEPTVRKVKLTDIKPKYEKPDISNVEVKRVKLSEESTEPKKEKRIKNTDKSDEDKSDSNTNETDTDEEKTTLNLSYFVKMPKSERKAVIKAVMRLISSLLKGVLPKDFYLKGTVGLSDPSLTGEVVGAAWALNGILNRPIELEAVFDREVIEGELSVKGRIVPAFMIFYVLRFIVVKPVREIIILLIKG